MANAILLNQSTSLTKENILDVIGGVVTGVTSDTTNKTVTVTLTNKDGSTTTVTIQNFAISDVLSNSTITNKLDKLSGTTTNNLVAFSNTAGSIKDSGISANDITNLKSNQITLSTDLEYEYITT